MLALRSHRSTRAPVPAVAVSRKCINPARKGVGRHRPFVKDPVMKRRCRAEQAVAFTQYPSLEDRVVLITGGASGVGAAMVEAFAVNKARVAFVDAKTDISAALVNRLSDCRHTPLFLECDLSDISQLRQSVEEAREALGPVAVLINNGANGGRLNGGEVTPDIWDQAMAMHLRHQFFAAQAVHPHMIERGGGSIVNFSSIIYHAAGAANVSYASAKGGVIGLTDSLASEFGSDTIRVNAIAPGAVMTERQLRLWYSEEQAGEVAGRQLIKRWVLPEDIARTALFLASDDSAMITRQCITVDAGIR